MERHSALNNVQPSVALTYIIPVFVKYLSPIYEAVCIGRYWCCEIFAPVLICSSKADDCYDGSINGWAAVYLMTTQLEHEGSNSFEQQILKQKGLTTETSAGIKMGGLSRQPCTCFVCAEGRLEGDEGRTRLEGGGGVTMETISTSAPGFPLDWPLPPLLKPHLNSTPPPPFFFFSHPPIPRPGWPFGPNGIIK